MIYIIDFDRVNELTTHPNDGKDKSPYALTTSVYSITKNYMKRYLEIFEDRDRKKSKQYSDEEVKEAIAILVYNRVLISQADIRDEKINKILE